MTESEIEREIEADDMGICSHFLQSGEESRRIYSKYILLAATLLPYKPVVESIFIFKVHNKIHYLIIRLLSIFDVYSKI